MCVFGTDFCLKRIFFDVAVYVCTQDREKICFRRKDVQMVEMRRIELLTPCLQGRCSPSWATPPFFKCHRFCLITLMWFFVGYTGYRLIYLASLSSCSHLSASQLKCCRRTASVYVNAFLLRNKAFVVGLSGLEPPTSRLSGVRSNRLSYRPILS